MLNRTIYPKTKRIKSSENLVEITEKLDGSNLCIFKLNGGLQVAQRNKIFSFEELEKYKNQLYPGLREWLEDNHTALDTLVNNAVVCGEWLGMGRIKYPIDEFDKRFYMFAKANIDDDLSIFNLRYHHDLFKYPFDNLEIPDCIGLVPTVATLEFVPTKDRLDNLYDRYVNKVGRNVEGFVVNYNNNIEKYVRMKNGKLKEHVG